MATAARKLGLDPERDAEVAREWLSRITRRLADRDSPFHKGLLDVLREPLACEEALAPQADALLGVLAAYARSPSFVARYLPLEEPEVRAALEERETSSAVIQTGVAAMRHALTERHDASAMSVLDKVREFLRFARELAEAAGQGRARPTQGATTSSPSIWTPWPCTCRRAARMGSGETTWRERIASGGPFAWSMGQPRRRCGGG